MKLIEYRMGTIFCTFFSVRACAPLQLITPSATGMTWQIVHHYNEVAVFVDHPLGKTLNRKTTKMGDLTLVAALHSS